MSKDKLVIIAIQEEYLSIITKQIEEIFGNVIDIRSVTVKDLTMNMVKDDEIVLVSVNVIIPLIRSIIPPEVPIIIGKRAINFVNIKKLLDIPLGKNILVINDTKYNTEETVEELRESVFEHNYYAYYPNESIPKFIDYVVTPGERQLIPKGMLNVIDIGVRVIDIETILEICKYFQIQYNYSSLVKKYMKSLVALSVGNDFIEEDKKLTVLQNYDNVKFKFDNIIAESKEMKKLIYIARKIAITDKIVYILGEMGTGKSMLAQAIHNDSNYKNGPFISINCSAYSMDDFENKLLGIENGIHHIDSLFAMAKNGTLCIEEIGEMPLKIQEKLVKAITNEKKSIPINLRVIVTSSINISQLVDKGLFRKDLFEILFTSICRVPSLKERTEDFEFLVNLCLNKYLHCEDMIITDKAIEELKKYSWCGNVGELFNVIAYMASLNKKVITEKSIPYFIKIKNKENSTLVNDYAEIDKDSIIDKLEKRGFLKESIAILEIFEEGKKINVSYGRNILRKILENKGFNITDQQLRLRLQVLNEFNLLIIRQGRSGTTISKEGQNFLKKLKK